jgi:integrase
MPSVTITTRQTASGPRHVVRYRLGGRAYPLVHAGSFRTKKDANTRRDLVGGELAAGRNPQVLLDRLRDPAPIRTFADWADAYRLSRVDIAPSTRENLEHRVAALLSAFTYRDVQEWIAGQQLMPSTIRSYTATLRQVLDYAEVDPNPARDARVKLPRQEHEQVTPPSRRDVELMVTNAPERWRLLLTVLAETGMRVSELLSVEWSDVDVAGERLRVQKARSKTKRARWVPVSAELVDEILRATPPDDRAGRVFQGSRAAVERMMGRACQRAGIAHYSPHDLRHRWASLKVKQGVPITEIAAHLGHSQHSMSLDVYSHVLLDD